MKSFVHLLMISLLATLLSCSSNPHKAEKIDTQLEKTAPVSADQSVGVKDGQLVVQKKTQMNEELRILQNDVYELEDKVYGNRKFGSQGLYGKLKQCKIKLSDKKNGGEGKLQWTEPLDRLTDKEDDFQIGLDEKDKLVAVSEEFLKDRLTRFREYKRILMKREDEYSEKNDLCTTELKEQLQSLKEKSATQTPPPN